MQFVFKATQAVSLFNFKTSFVEIIRSFYIGYLQNIAYLVFKVVDLQLLTEGLRALGQF